MIRKVKIEEKIIEYNLERKSVKNINLRIKPDGSVNVSANRRVSAAYIDSFVLGKSGFIFKALDSYNSVQPNLPTRTQAQLVNFVNAQFEHVFNQFRKFGIDKPELKFRKMKSRWGSCNYADCIITLSNNLAYCTDEQIYYVIIHEFAHLLVHNHSKDFYALVERFCPEYKRIRKEMNNIVITE